MSSRASFLETIDRIQKFMDSEKEAYSVAGRTRLLSHGQSSERAILFFHGYTSCPQQFALLGQRFFERGWNVLIPRAPHHGLADRMTDATKKQKKEELCTFAETSYDLAKGLGEELTIAGLSMGGTLTAWLAQTKKGISNAIIIAPAFGAKVIPAPIHDLARIVMHILPDTFRWWDPIQKDKLEGAKHAYPRYSTYGMLEIFNLAWEVRKLAKSEKPKADKMWVVLNENDEAINAELANTVYGDLKKRKAKIHKFIFPKEMGLDHDLIEPDHPKANIAVVYPELIRLAEESA